MRDNEESNLRGRLNDYRLSFGCWQKDISTMVEVEGATEQILQDKRRRVVSAASKSEVFGSKISGNSCNTASIQSGKVHIIAPVLASI